ncbi:MarR family winged helix-turn-helix transcriptional regulator [Brachybacterium sp. DNPG3]
MISTGSGTSASSSPEDDDLLLELGEAVVDLARRLQLDAHALPDVVPLTGTEVMVLRYVDHHPGTTPSLAAEGTGLRRSNLSAALRALTARGFVVREKDPEDSRITRLRTTELAGASRDGIRAHWAGVLAESLPRLDAEQREILRRAAEILRAAAD